MNIYLDIDGVLLHDSLSNHGTPANFALDFLREVTNKHDCYWLTTHCHGGENHAVEYLSKRFPLEANQYLKRIKPTDWKTWKTEAIDFTQDFRWVDDDVYELEYIDLDKHNCREKLILINLQNNPNQLKEVNNFINGGL